MKEKEIKEIIKKGESEMVEFKSSLSEWRSALETLTAFSWNKGGKIIFGVSRTGKINGVEIGKGTIESLANTIKQNTDPKLYPSIKVFKIKDKDIILVETEKISNEPVLAFGKAYKRIGKSTHQMSREEYKRVIRDLYEQEFDGEICEKASLKDIDEKVINWFRNMYKEINKKELRGSNKEVLKSLSCLRELDGVLKVTNAGILLFGKDPGRFFPRYYVTIARYPGKDIGTAYLEIKDIEGNLFEVIDKSEAYIKKHIETVYMLKEGQVAREPILQYPDFVIRELITNAIAHRDYRIKGSRVLIKMFKDRIEFDSPGGFPGDVNENNILEEQFSRNPITVKVLNKIKYIEEMGEGWNRIIDEINNYPLKFEEKPEIKSGTRVVVSLFSPELGVGREIDLGKLNERQRKAIEYIKEHNKITRAIYDQLFNTIPRTSQRELKELIRRGFVEKKERGYNVYYVLSQSVAKVSQSSGNQQFLKDKEENRIEENSKKVNMLNDKRANGFIFPLINKVEEGWDKIIDSIKKHPLQPKLPEIIDTGNTMIITIYSPKEIVEKEEEIDKNAVDKWLTQVGVRLTQELSKQEKEIILFVLKKRKITSENCQKLLNVSREMVNRYFRRLIERKLIKREGAGKYVYYILRVMQGNAKRKREKMRTKEKFEEKEEMLVLNERQKYRYLNYLIQLKLIKREGIGKSIRYMEV